MSTEDKPSIDSTEQLTNDQVDLAEYPEELHQLIELVWSHEEAAKEIAGDGSPDAYLARILLALAYGRTPEAADRAHLLSDSTNDK
ncbi:hypothetical protein [Halomarina ordinaria]|uniref:DUF357 domain-containing protein n=1 Tax=Halomarina ordinaria TaxID=3033939 RepID=A0ABD5U7B2_9EURY|nr:hypothetical protein [Halomarina sp. PSRA2]